MTVGVTTDPDGSEARIAVRDSGIGIAPEVLPTLFRAYSQADGSRDRSRGGLGLGLALVKNLVEMMGGRVDVDSAGEGRGSTFTLRLPLRPDLLDRLGTLASGEHRAFGATGPRPLQILVVDDRRDMAQILRRMLEADGHRVAVAEDGADGPGAGPPAPPRGGRLRHRPARPARRLRPGPRPPRRPGDRRRPADRPDRLRPPRRPPAGPGRRLRRPPHQAARLLRPGRPPGPDRPLTPTPARLLRCAPCALPVRRGALWSAVPVRRGAPGPIGPGGGLAWGLRRRPLLVSSSVRPSPCAPGRGLLPRSQAPRGNEGSRDDGCSVRRLGAPRCAGSVRRGAPGGIAPRARPVMGLRQSRWVRLAGRGRPPGGSLRSGCQGARAAGRPGGRR